MQIKKNVDNPILRPVAYFMCAVCWANTAEIYNLLFPITNSIFMYFASIGAIAVGILCFLAGICMLYIEEDTLGWKSIVQISITVIVAAIFLGMQLFYAVMY